MAWQKNKIWLVAKVEITDKDGNVKILYHKIAAKKSKRTGKQVDTGKKLTLKKYCNITKKHELYTESKF